MKLLKLVVLLCSCLTCPLLCQSEPSLDTSRSHILESARELMISAGLCALITVDEEGRPRVRTMDPLPPDEDLVVWMGTNPLSRKVSQIKKDNRVSLYYFDNMINGYVMLYGHAELIDSELEKKKRWKSDWEPHYENRTDKFLLIKIVPEWLEMIDVVNGIVADPETWTPRVIKLKIDK